MMDTPLAQQGESLKVHRDATRTRELVRVSIHSASSNDPLGELWVGYRRERPELELVD